MRDINFTYKKKEKNNEIKRQRILICMIAFVFIITSSFAYLHVQVTLCKEKSFELESGLSKFDEVVEVKNDIAKYNEKINYMTKLLDSVSEKAIINTHLLVEISSVMPNSIYLESYAVSNKGEINITGKSEDNDSIAYFVHELKQRKIFSGVSLKSVNKKEATDYNTQDIISPYEFNILVQINKNK